MSRRKTGKHPALGAPYGGTVTGRISGSVPDMHMQMAKRLFRRDPPPETEVEIDLSAIEERITATFDAKDVPITTGVDLAHGDDWGAIAVRKGTLVVLAAAAGAPAVIHREWINNLNAGRKAEREVIAMAFETIAKAHGATVERRESGRNPGYHSGEIDLLIALNGVGAMVSFSSLHGGDHALIHWFNTEYPARDLTQHFASAVRAGGNRSSHKATSFSDDWYGLAMALDAGLQLAARGEAFGEPTAP